MIYVIGSGPAGISCAAALLERGCDVTLLDVGLTLKNTTQKQHTAFDVNNPLKLVYNSDFPYTESQEYFSLTSDNDVTCYPSFAQGGLSNAWGAFVELFSENDFHDWPISLQQLKPYYEKILAFLNPAKAADCQCTSHNAYQHSQQATQLLTHWKKNQTALHHSGFEFNSATLAATFSTAETTLCKYCGLCQRGCPEGLIYSSTQTLLALKKNPHFHYIDNIIVDQFEESTHEIKILATHRLTKEKQFFSATQVFCGCGPIISTILFLRSTQQWNQKISFLDTAHFMFPCLMKTAVDNVLEEKLHTLCQLSLKLNHTAALQLYTYMDHYLQEMKQKLKMVYPLAAPFLKPFLNRLVIIQGFLHSSGSHQFELAVAKNGAAYLSAKKNVNVTSQVEKIISTMKQCKMQLGMQPLKSLLKISPIGKSFHFGGSLPMRISPRKNETDLFGKPVGFQRLHFIDASVFASIPAGSVTPTIMANAYRMGWESKIYE